MIDERINKSLQELENQLKEVESARKQVQNTVNSFDGLNTTTSNYVSSLNNIKTKLDEVVKLIGEDYKKKVQDFESDRAKIVNSANAVLTKIEHKAEEIQNSVDENIKSVQSKLLYSLILNVVILIALVAMFFGK